MGIFDGYLICTDCDGTMSNSKGELSAENAEAIRFFQKEGGLFTVATGRFPKHVLKFKEQFTPNTYQIVGNGTSIYDIENEVLVKEVTLAEPPREALEFVVRENLCHMIFVDFWDHSICWLREGMPRLERIESAVSSFEELFTVETLPWHKINFCFETPEETVRVQELMKQRFPQYKFERSWSTGIELLPKEGGKGPAVQQLAAMTKAKKVICIGDYENDVSMLQVADIGYAVENATELCKQAADRITVHHDQHAIAVIINELASSIEAKS